MPNEEFIYLGDTARLPYGSKSSETISKYLQQNIRFLKQYDVKAIVVACNSASSVIDANFIKSMNIPIFEVIGPGSENALNISKTKRIGVVGTLATIGTHAYESKLKQLCPDAMVFEQACPLFVPFIEEGLLDDPLTSLVVFRYLQNLLVKDIDTLILGCTHYPMLKKVFQKVTGSNIQLVDSSEIISIQLYDYLTNNELFNIQNRNDSHPANIQLLCTDLSERYLRLARKFLHPVELDNIVLVDI